MTELFIGIGVLFVLSLIPLALLYVRTYRKYREARVVTCPETRDTAAIKMDFLHAATSVATGDEELRVRNCSHWPKQEGCSQECTEQFASAQAVPRRLPALEARQS